MTETHILHYGPCLLIGASPDPVAHHETLRLLSEAYEVPVEYRHVLRVGILYAVAPTTPYVMTTLN